MEVSIKYLLPLVAVLNNKNYFCMIDYSYGNLYFLNPPEDVEIKNFLEKEILRKVDIVAVNDVKDNVDISSNVASILKDIQNDEIIKKYSVNLDLEENNEPEQEIEND